MPDAPSQRTGGAQKHPASPSLRSFQVWSYHQVSNREVCSDSLCRTSGGMCILNTTSRHVDSLLDLLRLYCLICSVCVRARVCIYAGVAFNITLPTCSRGVAAAPPWRLGDSEGAAHGQGLRKCAWDLSEAWDCGLGHCLVRMPTVARPETWRSCLQPARGMRLI